MKDALTKILKASELFNERLSVIMFNTDEYLMQKLVEEFDVKGLALEDFEKMLSDFSACLTNVSE